MTLYVFSDVVANPDLVSAFNPSTDVLRLETTATLVKIYMGSNTVTLETDIGSVTLPVPIESLYWENTFGNLESTTGWIKIGDNSPNTIDDAGPNQDYGSVVYGNQFHGLSGNDTYTGGNAGDLIYGNKGDDRILGYGGADTMYGGQGADVISGQTNPSGHQLIYGNLDADTIVSGSKNDTIYGGQGGDWIQSRTGTDVVYGNKDNDTISGALGGDTLYGGQGDDIINETDDTFVNVIYGNFGADTVLTGLAADTVYGGQGDDVIYGLSRSGVTQLVRGNRDDDLIYSGKGHDIIEGGPGADTLFSGATNGHDTIRGDSGDDVIIGLQNAAMIADGGDGNDTIDNRQGWASTLAGGNGDDVIKAGNGGGVASGNGGNDHLTGGVSSGNLLVGGTGTDTIVAGFGGTDLMAGGSGADVFQWNSHYALATDFQLQVKTTVPLTQIPDGYLGTKVIGTVRYASYTAGTDAVQDFGAGDQMRFNLADMIKPTLNLLTGAQGNKVLVQGFAQTSGGAASVKLAGILSSNFAGTAALLARLQQLTDPGFIREFYGFAANTAQTKLWVFQALNTDADANIDKASVLYTLSANNVFGGDIVIV